MLLAERCQPAGWFCQAAVAGWQDWGRRQNVAAILLVPSSAGRELSVAPAEGLPSESNLSLPRYKFRGRGVKLGKKCEFQLSPPMSHNRGGSPQSLLVTDSFIRRSRVGSKYNRFRSTCEHCGPDSDPIEMFARATPRIASPTIEIDDARSAVETGDDNPRRDRGRICRLFRRYISSTRTDQLVTPPPQPDGVYNFDDLDNVDK